MKKMFLGVLLCALFASPAWNLYAAEAGMTRERVIGGTFKGFAEAYLAVLDFEKEKKKFIEKLESVNEEEFSDRYAWYWRMMKEWPIPLRVKYGLKSQMTPEELVSRIKPLTKEDVRTLIREVPDRVVCGEFDRRLQRMGKQLQQAAWPRQVQAVWERINAKFRRLQGEEKNPAPVAPPGPVGQPAKGN